MLNPAGLEQQIKNALNQYLPPTFEEAAKQLMPQETDTGKEMCKAFGDTVAELLAEPLASSLASFFLWKVLLLRSNLPSGLMPIVT